MHFCRLPITYQWIEANFRAGVREKGERRGRGGPMIDRNRSWRYWTAILWGQEVVEGEAARHEQEQTIAHKSDSIKLASSCFG